MLFINDEQNLKKEKIRFFDLHLDFIKQEMPKAIQDYTFAFLNNQQLPSLNIQDIDLKPSGLTLSNLKLYYSIIYICFREIDVYWKEFFNHIQPLSLTLDYDFSTKFNFDNTTSPQSNLYTIRQCRVDKPKYTSEAIVNIGFYNKNENFNYHCYDEHEAETYINQHCSAEALTAYQNIQYPQPKSDFFLMASLYTEGGVSADVCSVAQSNLEILIKDSHLLLIYDDEGIDKKFVFTQPHNSFILYHLNCLIKQMSFFGADTNYKSTFSRFAFHNNFMDYYAFYYDYIKDISITFLHDDLYTAFTNGGTNEENLSTPSDFPFVVASGAFRNNKISQRPNALHDIKISKNNFYMPPTNNVIVIGQDNCPHFTNKTKKPYTVPSLKVWEVDDICLTGLGWLWKDNKYISFDSSMPNLPFNPQIIHDYRITHNNITEVINEECIIAISAGFTCYGHYLVDDLPRIGLIKDYLGDEFYNKKFVISTITPQWAKDLLKFSFGLSDEHFLLFDNQQDTWQIKKVILSSFPSTGNYDFHNYIHEFYKRYSLTNVKPHRLVCFSRDLCDPNRKHQRIFESRKEFETTAISYGFEVICPETLSIQQQIQLMSETICQIGEHGSAQHSSVFNTKGMVVGTLNPIGDIQLALGRIYNDTNILCYSDGFHWGGPNNEVLYYDIDHKKLQSFFDKIHETLEKTSF